MGIRADARQFETALRNRWEIEPEYKRAMITRLMRIIADPSSSNREVTSASRALIAAEAQNQQDEPIPKQRASSIVELLERVRTIDCIEAVSGERTNGDSGPPEVIDLAADRPEDEYPAG